MWIPMLTGLAITQAANLGPIEVTVYNQGFGLVKEVRAMNLRAGRQSVAIEDVPQQIETNSIGIKSLTDPDNFEVLEQNYQYDLISPLAILNKAVGKKIRLTRFHNGQREVIIGTLLSTPSTMVGTPDGGHTYTWNGMVVRTDSGEILLNPSGEVSVTELPDGLISKPTLLWDLVTNKAGQHNVELSYLTRGMSWKSDYVLTLDGSGAADLKGWVTLNNQSGATFANAKLKLLAGEVNRAERNRGAMAGAPMEMRDMSAKSGFQEESLFEYHLYTLQRPTDLRQNETKQVSLLEATGVKVSKKLIVDSMMNFGVYYPSEGEIGTGTLSPQVRIEFINSQNNKLGMPLPMGTVKVYQRDKSGSVQMLGEDNIKHTPKDETISLVIGRSFDVVAERKRLNFRRLSDRSFEETFEVEIRNRKEVPETVIVLERHYGDWKVVNTSQEWIKLDSTTQQYTVNLKANETKKVTYTVQTRW
jgi:hypothetical protein